MEDKKYLAYVRQIGTNAHGQNEYEFFFTETPDTVWGQDWNELCPSACGDIPPEPSTYSNIERLSTNINFFCAQKNSCFSMQDMIDGVIACAFESLDGLDEYPSPFRLVFKFGEDKETVEDLLAQRQQFFKPSTEGKVEDSEIF